MSEAARADPVSILEWGKLEAALLQLRKSLQRLPSSLPDNVYDFRGFTASEDDIDKYGHQGVLNHVLEVTFCPAGRQSGPFLLTGRGPGLVAVVDVLTEYIAQFPQDAMLQKWILDLIAAAEHTCTVTKVRLCKVISGHAFTILAEW